MVRERERGITVSVPGIQLGVMKRALGKRGDEDSMTVQTQMTQTLQSAKWHMADFMVHVLSTMKTVERKAGSEEIKVPHGGKTGRWLHVLLSIVQETQTC